MNKRIGSHAYYTKRFGITAQQNKEGYLFAQGRYPTKIKAEDLPEWFIDDLTQPDRIGYFDCKNVVDLVYAPNDLLEEGSIATDLLYISYKKEIKITSTFPLRCCEDWDEVIAGYFILDFLREVEAHSDFNADKIIVEILDRNRRREKEYTHRLAIKQKKSQPERDGS